MDEKQLRQLLEKLAKGGISVAEALEELRYMPYSRLPQARIDHHRQIRTGFPEVVFGQGKSFDQLSSITSHLLEEGAPVIITRIEEETADRLDRRFPGRLRYFEQARIVLGKEEAGRVHDSGSSKEPEILVVTAGTADVPVAEEAAVICGVAGQPFGRIYDVGVAGLHRLIDVMPELSRANVIIVAAGMEGALASLVAGLTGTPVIGVPTSVGYGANLHGLTPLMAMLNSCAPGLSVVNIDNGFGAAMCAIAINRLVGGGSRSEAEEG